MRREPAARIGRRRRLLSEEPGYGTIPAGFPMEEASRSQIGPSSMGEGREGSLVPSMAGRESALNTVRASLLPIAAAR